MLSLSFSTLQAGKLDIKSVKTKETKTEIRNRLELNVSRTTLGDVLVKLPKLNEIQKPNSQYLPRLLAGLIFYIFPDADLDKLYEDMLKYKEPNIKQVVTSIDRYLGAKNAHMREASYSQGNVRLLIEDGLPLFAFLVADETAFNKILERGKNRPSGKVIVEETEEEESSKNTKNSKTTKNTKKTTTLTAAQEAKALKEAQEEKELKDKKAEWIKILRKDYQKKFYNSDNTAFDALISGYNKDTREYQISSAKFGTFWILETELKESVISLYQLRF